MVPHNNECIVNATASAAISCSGFETNCRGIHLSDRVHSTTLTRNVAQQPVWRGSGQVPVLPPLQWTPPVYELHIPYTHGIQDQIRHSWCLPYCVLR